MCMDKITGKNNDLVKDIKRLISSSKKRREKGLFVLEGARLTFDVLNSLYETELFLITEASYEKYEDKARAMCERAKKAYIISDEVSEKLSDTVNSQGIYALCRMRDTAFEIKEGGRYIVLDNVQDPGNVGAILRTAEALGMDGALIGGGCDIFNPKALRASMGSALRINVVQSDSTADMVKLVKDKGLPVFATTPDKNAESITEADFSSGGACVIGNEANGVSGDIVAVCDGCVTIKMLGNAESLNAASAAAITMWEMLR